MNQKIKWFFRRFMWWRWYNYYEYEIVVGNAYAKDNFEEKVMDLMEQGYLPSGSLFLTEETYVQAMMLIRKDYLPS
jgi:hypothetical protein